MLNELLHNISGKNVLVIGAGLSGREAAVFLAAKGAKVVLADNKQASELEGLPVVENAGVDLCLGQMPEDVSGFALAVISPGVPLAIPVVAALDTARVPLIGELELAYHYSRSPFLAITGTNGKTTTTTLLGYILQQAGRPCYVGGNIGAALVDGVEQLASDAAVVAELSSFQLETAVDFHAHIAAFLNLTPDHLYRHETMENYGNIKTKIFAHQDKDDFAVLNYDDAMVRSYAPRLSGTVVYFSRKSELECGMFLKGDKIVWRFGGIEQEVIAAADILIKGPHNLENALAASAMAALYGVELSVIAEALKSFPGVEHRQEPVGEFNGVIYINDSKGTNPDSTLYALAACERPTVLILGGFSKGSDFHDLLPLIKEKVKHIVLLGETADVIAATLDEAGFTAYEHAGYDFTKCVKLAIAAAEPGDEVLLSPACASWDMFKCFEERGEEFKRLVKELA
ncbi:MAG TPA: UDP-N-acetylmuramoyl-L-alanine--D-glutamate ligase [Candidatus Avidehalobacter gallistercoris]|uniref:UDP-N-acetylmuramoylalanine--D-glutamate ligase n=1 Tax=Candidatus Avidehalobacter gallistercoris TaxID=2840694 RepID=A0A9D1L015_9FIRM|nr:UDP-N-acetylmuramoyl-L-alanine--D-glutamate ligase [Candidatus Avidehalobacter gallistercoris]